MLILRSAAKRRVSKDEEPLRWRVSKDEGVDATMTAR
jgi:hypothetical protein